MMQVEDREMISAHVRAKESGGDFRPSIDAAYTVIRETEEYQQMAAILMHKFGITVTPELADLALCALALGFAFGEDFGQARFAHALMVDGRIPS
jgi:hypothetical protein